MQSLQKQKRQKKHNLTITKGENHSPLTNQKGVKTMNSSLRVYRNNSGITFIQKITVHNHVNSETNQKTQSYDKIVTCKLTGTQEIFLAIPVLPETKYIFKKHNPKTILINYLENLYSAKPDFINTDNLDTDNLDTDIDYLNCLLA